MEPSPNLCLHVLVQVCLDIYNLSLEGGVRGKGGRQGRECERRSNGVRESTSKEDEKSNKSMQLGVLLIIYVFNRVFGFLVKQKRGIKKKSECRVCFSSCTKCAFEHI